MADCGFLKNLGPILMLCTPLKIKERLPKIMNYHIIITYFCPKLYPKTDFKVKFQLQLERSP